MSLCLGLNAWGLSPCQVPTRGLIPVSGISRLKNLFYFEKFSNFFLGNDRFNMERLSSQLDIEYAGYHVSNLLFYFYDFFI